MAYMSEAGGRRGGERLEGRADGLVWCGVDAGSPMALRLGASALREAERILAETERGTEATTLTGLSGNRRMHGFTVAMLRATIADRLAAVLPVLDELASEQSAPIFSGDSTDARNVAERDRVWRNRATMAAMGARQ